MQGEKVLLKLDVKNVFNSIGQDTVLQAAQTHLPEIYPSIWDCYSSKTSLFHSDFRLDSATGVQQGDPLGPALFALAIHRVTSEVKSDLNVWYLDDRCIGGDPQTVLSNAAIIRNGLSSSLGMDYPRATSSIFHIEKLPLNPQVHIPTAKCTMLQVQKGTGGVRHSHKNQHGKNMQCVFWRRKLVTSIPTNQTCRPGSSFCGRPIPAMFPVIVSCL